MDFPKKYRKYGPDEVPPSVKTLIAELLPQLLDGPHPALAALREQLQAARVTEVEMTGVGFYVDFEVPADCPLAEPPDFEGGSAEIDLTGVSHGAGCVVFVRQGRLATFEGYTYDGTWEIDALIIAIKTVVPVFPG
jgi:hypothetical protein